MSFIQWEHIDPTLQDKPETWRWKLPEMQKISLTDSTLFWQIGFNGYNLIIWKGQADGKITPYMREIKENSPGQNKNLNTQAWSECSKRYMKKRRGGYLPPCSGEKRMIKIMRGYEYDKKKG